MLRNPSGPINHASGSRIAATLSRIGLANFEINEPRSRVMSPRTTCGGETVNGCPGVQDSGKSIKIFAFTDGRMFARSPPSALKSTTPSARKMPPPEIWGSKILESELETISETVRRPSPLGSFTSIEPPK